LREDVLQESRSGPWHRTLIENFGRDGGRHNERIERKIAELLKLEPRSAPVSMVVNRNDAVY